MKIKLCRVIKVICFCLIAVFMVSMLSDLLKPKWLEYRWQSSKTNKSFYDLETNSTEVMFLGSSVISAAIDPYQLYEEKGISSYNLGVMSQPMLGTYFWFKEALKNQDMKVAVIEIKSAGRLSEKEEAKARKSYDYMEWGSNKMQYAMEYSELHEDVSLWEYLFSLSLYHNRWSELVYDDYDFLLGNDDSYTKGFSTLTTEFVQKADFSYEKYEKGNYDGFEVDSEETSKVNEVNDLYLRKLIQLAKEENVELLFVKTPDTRWDVEQHNHIQNIADENGIPFLDFNLKSLRKEMNFEYITDAADVIHLNIKGAKKMTDYIGEYLTKHYDLTDYREGDNNVKKSYEQGMANYKATMKNANLQLMTDLDEYLGAINNDRYVVILTAGSNAKEVYFTENQQKLLMELGVDNKMFEAGEFGVNLISVKNSNSKLYKVQSQDEKGTITLSLGGTINNETDYSITAGEQGCLVRLNDHALEDVKDKYFNIVVYDKEINKVADVVYLYSANGNLIMNR